MRIFVCVKAGAKKEFVKKIDITHCRIAVRATPQNGQANRAITRSLANYFGISFSRVNLIAGGSQTQKVFDVL